MGKPTPEQLEAMHAAIMQNALDGNLKAARQQKAIYEAVTEDNEQEGDK